MRALLVLQMVMTESGEESHILDLATTAVTSLSQCQADALFLNGTWRPVAGARPKAGVRARLDDQVAALARAGGPVTIPGRVWAWAYPMDCAGGVSGLFIVGCVDEPKEHEQHLVRALAQQTGVALANARLHAREREIAEALRVANTGIERSMVALQRNLDIHGRLTQVAVAGEGLVGIARALHELTAHPVAIEDRYGNLRAWAGPDQPEPYPKVRPALREQMLRRVLEAARPLRTDGRIVAVAQPRDDVMGVLTLIDPKETAGETDLVALEHGATVLALELVRLRSMAETELRVRRDLVEDLLAGTEEGSAVARAAALGYDLSQPRRVVVVEGRSGSGNQEVFFNAVRRAARDQGAGSLLVARVGTVVVLAEAEADWEPMRVGVVSGAGHGGRCRVGVGSVCSGPSDFPRSYREAQLALRLQRASRGVDQVTAFEDLGVYRVLSEVADSGSVERFVQQWLGPLIEYDGRKHADLVTTLSGYLECGGAYDTTATFLSVHRSTLRYRLQRIREISGHDLGDPDTRFNLQLATRAWTTLGAMREP